MQVGIVGLPRSGKTTVFNAVTRGTAEVGSYASPQGQPNVGVIKIPDERLDTLAAVFDPKRTVPAEVSFVDIPGAPEGTGRTRSIASGSLNYLQPAGAILLVARAFEDPSVSHIDGNVEPVPDVEAGLLELAFADLEVLDRRLRRLAEISKGAKAPERETLAREESLVVRVMTDLEAGTAVRDQSLSQKEVRHLEGFRLLTAKPLIVVVNAGENQLPEDTTVEAQLASSFDGPHVGTAVLCGKLEMELAQMEPEEEQEFREGLGAGESSMKRIIKLSHYVAGLITFFTGNPNEVRAWTIPGGTTALGAAGKIHSDFQRGFIRAEVIGAEELVQCGSIAEARKRGVLRQEGKSYVVKDSDVVNILFSV